MLKGLRRAPPTGGCGGNEKFKKGFDRPEGGP